MNSATLIHDSGKESGAYTTVKGRSRHASSVRTADDDSLRATPTAQARDRLVRVLCRRSEPSSTTSHVPASTLSAPDTR